jgi:hypothetical protein
MSRAMRLKGIQCESGTVPAAVSPNYYRCIKPLVAPTTEKEQREIGISQNTCSPIKKATAGFG